MSKILLPMFVGVFVGAFVVELFRRNNPEMADELEAKARRAARSLPRLRWPRREPERDATSETDAAVPAGGA